MFLLLVKSSTIFNVCNSSRKFWFLHVILSVFKLSVLLILLSIIESFSVKVTLARFSPLISGFNGKVSSKNVKSVSFSSSLKLVSPLKFFNAVRARLLNCVSVEELSQLILQNFKNPIFQIYLINVPMILFSVK